MHNLTKPLLAALIAVTALSACGQKPTEAAGMPTPQVSVASPLKQNVTDWDEFVGRFEASQHVDVRARAGGFIQAVHFKDGQTVKKGQLLFTLDSRPAQAALASAEADAAVARKAFERAEVLMKDQAISRQDFDQRRATLDVADAVLRARKLDVEFTRVTASGGFSVPTKVGSSAMATAHSRARLSMVRPWIRVWRQANFCQRRPHRSGVFHLLPARRAPSALRASAGAAKVCAVGEQPSGTRPCHRRFARQLPPCLSRQSEPDSAWQIPAVAGHRGLRGCRRMHPGRTGTPP